MARSALSGSESPSSPGLGVVGHLDDPGVAEQRRVEGRRLFALGVEPQARNDLSHDTVLPVVFVRRPSAVTVLKTSWHRKLIAAAEGLSLGPSNVQICACVVVASCCP
jgi:hypothetical protein